jgi:hypothetical protein
MKKTLFITLFAILIMTSSSQTLLKGFIRFETPKDELISTSQIREFMKININPSIVIRPIVSEKQVSLSDPNGYLYNAMEKELSNAGFQVKDRGLLMEAEENSSKRDYRQIKQLKDVDLVLEVIQIENNKKYTTDRVWRENGKEKILHDYYSVTKYGAIIEYKLVIVKNNEFGGSYMFNYAPCSGQSNDCSCIIAFKDVPDRIYPTISFCEKKSKSVFDYVDKNIIEELVRNGIKKMNQEIRN